MFIPAPRTAPSAGFHGVAAEEASGEQALPAQRAAVQPAAGGAAEEVRLQFTGMDIDTPAAYGEIRRHDRGGVGGSAHRPLFVGDCRRLRVAEEATEAGAGANLQHPLLPPASCARRRHLAPTHSVSRGRQHRRRRGTASPRLAQRRRRRWEAPSAGVWWIPPPSPPPPPPHLPGFPPRPPLPPPKLRPSTAGRPEEADGEEEEAAEAVIWRQCVPRVAVDEEAAEEEEEEGKTAEGQE